MSISLKPEHLKHYKDVALLLFKYGRGDLVQRAGLSELLPNEPQHDKKAAAAAEEFAADIERLGPTFIKLGQLLSTRPDIVPPAHADALARLQDKCEPLPFSQIEAVLEQELGAPPSRLFLVDPEPLATASMSQVHRRGGVPARAHRVRAALRRRSAVRGVQEVDAARARLPAGDDAPAHHLGQPARDPRDHHSPAGARLHHLARAGDGIHPRHQDHRAHAPGEARARRRPARRRAVPRLSEADPARWRVPRRSASGQRVPGRRPRRPDRPRHGGARHAGKAPTRRASTAASPISWRSITKCRSSRPRSAARC